MSLAQPSSSLHSIISTAIIASSTSSPSAIINAPSEIFCNVIPIASIARNTAHSTSGMLTSTTSPARSPRLMKHTASTITTASPSDWVNSPIDSSTTFGWSDTWLSCMPAGISRLILPIAAFSPSPSSRTLPPVSIATVIAIAGLPLK